MYSGSHAEWPGKELGSIPISGTARVRGARSGDWEATATVVEEESGPGAMRATGVFLEGVVNSSKCHQ